MPAGDTIIFQNEQSIPLKLFSSSFLHRVEKGLEPDFAAEFNILFDNTNPETEENRSKNRKYE